MAKPGTSAQVGVLPDVEANRVALVGRLTKAPSARELPSGDVVVSFRISVPRAGEPHSPRTPRSDWVDCAVWDGRLRRSCSRWQVGDLVEVEGSLRRRVFRGEGGMASLVEVEVRSGRRVERAERGQS